MPLRYTGVKMPMESATTYQARNPVLGDSVKTIVEHLLLRYSKSDPQRSLLFLARQSQGFSQSCACTPSRAPIAALSWST